MNNYSMLFEEGKENKGRIEAMLQRADVDPKRRGESLAIEDFARIYEALKSYPELKLAHKA